MLPLVIGGATAVRGPHDDSPVGILARVADIDNRRGKGPCPHVVVGGGILAEATSGGGPPSRGLLAAKPFPRCSKASVATGGSPLPKMRKGKGWRRGRACQQGSEMLRLMLQAEPSRAHWHPS